MNKQQLLDMKTDMKLLLECLDYQRDNTSAQKQALMTLASSLQSSAECQDEFRECGGLQQVLEMVTHTRSAEVTEAGLFCLGSAVESNVYSQKLLSSASIFSYLHGVLSELRGGAVRKKQTASFLLLCLVSNNGFGQNLMRQSSCLHDIISLIRTTLPKNTRSHSEWFEGIDGISVELWSTLVSTACVCVNNPQNEENQRICASLFPYLFSLLQHHTDDRIVKPTLSLLGLTVSNNVANQERIRKCGGLEILVGRLGTLQKCLADDTKVLATVKQLLLLALLYQTFVRPRLCQLLSQWLYSSDDCKSLLKALLKLNGIYIPVANQDRIRKCGGLEILVSKLGTLQKCLSDDTKGLPTVIQLLNTIDSCITDHEANSEKFGALGGVRLVIRVLSACPLNEHDKTQTVLTLAHAVDICRANQKYITESDGITVLIHQLTLTEDLELSKTIKYLLHICVASGKLGDDELEEDEHSDAGKRVSKAEQLKRHGELEILKKINELDSKLKNIQERGSQLKSMEEEGPSHEMEKELFSAEIMSPQSAVPVQSSLAQSGCGSRSAEHTCQQATPREQSLIDQLVQEKVERQRLELLNKMLQENMLMKSMLQSRETEERKNQGEGNEANDNSLGGKLDISKLSDHNNSAATRSGRKYNTGAQNAETFTEEPVQNKSNSRNFNRDIENPTVSTANAGKRCADKISPSSIPFDLRKRATNTRSSPRIFMPTVGLKTAHQQVSSSQNTPVDLSARSQNTQVSKNAPVNLSSKPNNVSLSKNEVLDLSVSSTTSMPKPRGRVTRAATSRHAEIQCGTPCVANMGKNEELLENTVVSITRNRTKTAASQTKKDKCLKQSNKNEDVNNKASKTPLIVISDINRNKVLKNLSSARSDEATEGPTVEMDRVSRTSSDKFVKPTTLPPRSKIRVTPRLGTGPTPGSSRLVNPKPTAAPIMSPSNTRICSEFDRDLVCKLRNKSQPIIRPPPSPAPPSVKPQKKTYVKAVVKSQNNTKKLDKQLAAANPHSATDSWYDACPRTPAMQSIVPPRPAFSDCGMRRPCSDSPCSVMSVGKLDRPIGMRDDSGFYSPDMMLRNVNSETSSVDSNIEWLRSDSDPSDEEAEIKLTPAKLRPRPHRKQPRRSSRLTQKVTSQKCPETSPDTCKYHRQVRKIERAHIQTMKKGRKQQQQNKRLLEKTVKKRPSLKRKKEEKSVYELTSDSNEDYISPSVMSSSDSENGTFLNHLPQRAKLRRRRVPYTEEEEFNLLEGVRRLGKHWNQILVSYKFHPSRTNVDLKDKHKRLMAAENRDTSTVQGTSKGTLSVIPFSMCEERRLRRGVKKCGYNWKTILQSFTFAKGRTTEDLRNKWRSLHRKKLVKK